MRLAIRPLVSMRLDGFSASSVRALVLGQRLVRAALISTFVFCCYRSPIRGFFLAPLSHLTDWMALVLDWPIATAALALPEEWRPFSTWYQRAVRLAPTGEFRLTLWRYLSVGLPVYFVLLTLLAGLRKWLRPRPAGRPATLRVGRSEVGDFAAVASYRRP